MRYRIDIEYDGTRYSGWQKQPNAPTIQEEIEKALAVIFKTEIPITGSGRTDAGVHARGQVAHFDTPDPLEIPKILHSLNGLLPNDISIYKLEEVHPEFHSRFDATEREYRYYFSSEYLPLLDHMTAYWKYPLDFQSMNEAAQYLQGDTDCTSFTPPDPSQPHLRCIFFEARFIKGDDREPHTFIIRGNRFLRSVVRSLMGTLILVGRGMLTPDDFRTLISHPNRSKAGPTAPAKGLVLHRVIY